MPKLILKATVEGRPVSQGSMRPVMIRGKPSMVHNNNKLKPYRTKLANHFKGKATHYSEDDRSLNDAAYKVSAKFYFTRDERVNSEYHQFNNKSPDLDKLERALFDALTESEVIKDDSQIVACESVKVYDDIFTGVEIELYKLNISDDKEHENC
jgi:Holliday junction resolvase RusA-like endonuclease